MKKIFMLLIVVFGSKAIWAQGGNFVISYPISFPMGDLKDYIGATSFRGISLEFNKRQKPNLDIGLEASWHTFYERQDSKPYTNETSTITGVQYRYTNAVPLLAQAKWLRSYQQWQDDCLMPGLALVQLMLNALLISDFTALTNDAWQFCLRPELGVQIQAGYGASFMLGVKYYANFAGGDLDAQSYLSINIGFVFSGD